MVQLMNGHGVHSSGVADPDSRSHCSWTILVCVTPISLLPRICGFFVFKDPWVRGLRMTLGLSEDFLSGSSCLSFCWLSSGHSRRSRSHIASRLVKDIGTLCNRGSAWAR